MARPAAASQRKRRWWAWRLHWRTVVLYALIIPALLSAATFLGYFTWRTARQAAQLGERAIVQSTLVLALEKVDRVEQMIISADNRIFARFDGRAPTRWSADWRRGGARDTPSVRALLVSDATGKVQGFAFRGDRASKRRFLQVYFRHLLPRIEATRPRSARLQHLHTRVAGRSYLLSWRRVRAPHGQRFLLVAAHAPSYMLREVFPKVFRAEGQAQLYNVVDEDNRRIFGPSLRQAGDYLVAQRFPTTFYRWRLQVAPKQAPLLEAQGESRRINEAAMLVISLAIILIGITFLLYASLQERRLSALKSDFVANVSHELKTPLSAIRMFAELLWRRDAVDVSKRQQYAQIIHDEAERLSALIDNVLDFAALERGKITYRFIEDSVLPAVQRTVAALQARFERLGMTLQCSVEGEVAPLRFDPQAVALVLTNLVDNAIKHAGGRRIQVHLHYGARHLRLSVRDFGPGIATTERERIFERFYRSKDGARGRGSGIGLALVKSVAQAHGGQVFAGPRADGAPGAEVGLTLPLARSATAALSLPPPPPPSTPLSVAE